ncbi:MAG: hypothetical protein JW864_06130 [Spirochaetes bacterium]|nr:hypothetical protein [Spirochaetota bacterium]
MNIITRIVGWAVLIFTEVMLGIAFFTVLDKTPIVGYQIAVFFTVWAAVAGKNVIDLKREATLGAQPLDNKES